MSTDKMKIKVMVDGVTAAKSKIKGLDTSIGGLVSTIGVGIAALLVFKKALDFGVETARVAGQFEQWEISFETMLGSAERAKIMMSDLFEFAAVTPFQIPDLVRNSKRLMGMGIEADKVIDSMRILGDVAAGVGVPIERLALNFGQVKAQAKLTGRELRDFAIAGVPLIGALSKSLGVAETEIQKMVSRGEIGFQDVEDAFRSMSSEGGKFYNLMARQNKSYFGQLSNLKDQYTQLKNAIGESFLPLIKEYMPELIDSTNYLVNQIKGINRVYSSQAEIISGLSEKSQESIDLELEKNRINLQYSKISKEVAERNIASMKAEYEIKVHSFNASEQLEARSLIAKIKAAEFDATASDDRIEAYKNNIRWLNSYAVTLENMPKAEVIFPMVETTKDLSDDIIAIWEEAFGIAKADIESKEGEEDKIKIIPFIDPEWKSKMEIEAEEAAMIMENRMQQAGSIMSNMLYEAFDGGFENIEEQFKNMLKRMMADLVISGLLSLLTGGTFGGTGMFGEGGLLGGLFGGAPVGGGQSATPAPIVNVVLNDEAISRANERGNLIRVVL